MPDRDIIPRYVPALSSTGDVPVFLSPPPESEEESAASPASSSEARQATPVLSTGDPAGGETQEDIKSPGLPPDEPVVEEVSTEPEPEPEPPAEAKPDPRTARIRAAEERAARLEGLLEKALSALTTRAEPPPAPPAPPVQPPPDPKPARVDFDNPEDYDAALVQWGTRAALAEHDAKVTAERAAEKAASDKAAADERAAAEFKAIDDRWLQRRQEVATKRADYVETERALVDATDEFNGQQTAAITAAIKTAADGPDLAYYLGKNPDEAKRIALIPDPMMQLFEMGKISAKLAQPKPVEVSRAPAPIVPLRGPSRAAERSLEEIGNEGTMDEYAAAKRSKREAEFRASHRGRLPH